MAWDDDRQLSTVIFLSMEYNNKKEMHTREYHYILRTYYCTSTVKRSCKQTIRLLWYRTVGNCSNHELYSSRVSYRTVRYRTKGHLWQDSLLPVCTVVLYLVLSYSINENCFLSIFLRTVHTVRTYSRM